MGIKEDILEEFKKYRYLTIEELADQLDKPKQTIRSVVNRDLKEKLEETGEYKNKFKIYKLPYETNMNNRILHDKIDKLENLKKDLIQGLNSFNSLFSKLTQIAFNNKEIKLSEYIDLVQGPNKLVDREFIKQLNQKLGDF